MSDTPERAANVYKLGPSVRVRVDAEGRPICPWDGETMVETAPTIWVCPIHKAAADALRDALVGALDKMIDGPAVGSTTRKENARPD